MTTEYWLTGPGGRHHESLKDLLLTEGTNLGVFNPVKLCKAEVKHVWAFRYWTPDGYVVEEFESEADAYKRYEACKKYVAGNPNIIRLRPLA